MRLLIKITLFISLITILSNGSTLATAQSPLTVTIESIDNQNFPDLTLTVNVLQNQFAPLGLNKDNFTVYEDGNTENLIIATQETLLNQDLAITFIFDSNFNPRPLNTDYRAMQEFSQALAFEFLKENNNTQIQIKTSTQQTLQGYTHNLSLIQSAIRSMIIENFETDKNLNKTLLNVLETAQPQPQVIFVFGPANQNIQMEESSPVFNLAQQKGIPIYTIPFAENPNTTYLETLAKQSKGLFITNITQTNLLDLKTTVEKQLKTGYILYIQSNLYQTDALSHTIAVHLNTNDQQAYTEKTYLFPSAQIIPTANLTYLLYGWALIGGTIALIFILIIPFINKLTNR